MVILKCWSPILPPSVRSLIWDNSTESSRVTWVTWVWQGCRKEGKWLYVRLLPCASACLQWRAVIYPSSGVGAWAVSAKFMHVFRGWGILSTSVVLFPSLFMEMVVVRDFFTAPSHPKPPERVFSAGRSRLLCSETNHEVLPSSWLLSPNEREFSWGLAARNFT